MYMEWKGNQKGEHLIRFGGESVIVCMLLRNPAMLEGLALSEIAAKRQRTL